MVIRYDTEVIVEETYKKQLVKNSAKLFDSLLFEIL